MMVEKYMKFKLKLDSKNLFYPKFLTSSVLVASSMNVGTHNVLKILVKFQDKINSDFEM